MVQRMGSNSGRTRQPLVAEQTLRHRPAAAVREHRAQLPNYCVDLAPQGRHVGRFGPRRQPRLELRLLGLELTLHLLVRVRARCAVYFAGSTDTAMARVYVMSTRSPTFTRASFARSRTFTVTRLPSGPFSVTDGVS